jgi:glutaredoxin
MTKEYFTQNNISFTDHNVAIDLEKRKEMLELTGQMGVPVIKIGDDIVIGFDQGHIAELLGL